MKESGRLDALSRRVVPWLIERRRGMLWLAIALTLIGVAGSVLLYSDLRSGVEELLPENAMSVRAARIVSPKMHSVSRLSIILDGHDADAMERFAEDLHAKLTALPKNLVDAVEYRTDDEDAYAKQFGLLYLDTQDLKTMRDKISARIAWEREHHNPLSLDVDDTTPAPEVDFKDLEAKYGDRMKESVDFRKGYYQTPDGQLPDGESILVMHVRPPETNTGLGANDKLVKAVKDQVAALNPGKYDPKLKVGYTGEVMELVEEQASLEADLAASTVIVLGLVLGALWLYYRRWGAIAAVFGPLIVGVAATFGAAYLMVGHLNGNTAFLGSIVIGNGINVGIIYVARYLEERRARTPVNESLRVAWASTIPATFVAAFGAALAYLSLASTDFRGFSQFGAIGFVGMAFCWLAVYAFLPPMLALLEGWRPIEPGRPLRSEEGIGRLTSLVQRFPLVFRGISIGVVGLFIFGVATYRGDVLEYNMAKLRSRESQRSGAQFWAKKADLVFRRYLTPVVLWGETSADLDKAIQTLNAHRKQMGAQDPFREVHSIGTLIPGNQEEKLPIIEELRTMLPPGRLKKMDPEMRKKVERIIPAQEARKITLDDLPAPARRALIERDGTVGRVALVFPSAVGVIDLHEAERLKAFVNTAIADSGAKVLVLSPLFLLSDIDDAIFHDGPQATALAFALVCLLVVVVFRKLKPSATVIGALLLGLAGLVGIAAYAGVHINFLNFVVLPITFGIGVDYAVNIIQRYEREGVGQLGRILQETGGAVALCSATTVIGYGSLMVADSQALSGFGLLAAAGEVTCLSSALLLMPAWLFPRKPKPVPSTDEDTATATELT